MLYSVWGVQEAQINTVTDTMWGSEGLKSVFYKLTPVKRKLICKIKHDLVTLAEVKVNESGIKRKRSMVAKSMAYIKEPVENLVPCKMDG